MDETKRAFAPARLLLLEAGVPFEPEELLQRDWRQRLASDFARMPELGRTLTETSGVLSGVYIADTLFLPEKIRVEQDVVVLARQVVFDGTDIEILAPGRSVSFFIIESEKKFARGRSASSQSNTLPTVYINVGRNAALKHRGSESFAESIGLREFMPVRFDGMGFSFRPTHRLPGPSVLQLGETANGGDGGKGTDGLAGQAGDPGADGTKGQNGTCPDQKNGGIGVGALWGGTGTDGTDADPGGSGVSGGGINYTIPPGSAGVYTFSAIGGNGGPGGTGGAGGRGGNGGTGGAGGDGASCDCLSGGPGNGGPGGTGGDGGIGGHGGKGGAGGAGGTGGTIQVTNQSCDATVTTSVNGGRGGTSASGGFGGESGLAGPGGSGGRPGSGSCTGVTVTAGSQGASGGPGTGGASGAGGGSGGAGGSAGTITITQATTGCGGSCDEIETCLAYDARCQCTEWSPHTPIILDINRNGYDLTAMYGGVRFDLDADGKRGLTAWTAIGGDDCMLVLDRNGNGTIDNGRELFGDTTPLPDGQNSANGWEALAQYDRPESGGNRDGIIDSRDTIFSQLRLWQDLNHDGRSQPSELYSLGELGIDAVSLDYQPEQRRDNWGNIFRYRARIEGHDVETGKPYKWFAYDVIFAPPPRH